MDKDELFMREAIKEAMQASENGEVPIGAVIVCNDRVIARGHNQTQLLSDPTAHAEMLALTSATGALSSRYLCDCSIYVTVEPCPMCAAALNWAQISRIVYGAADPKRGYTLFSPSLLHPKTSVSSGILEKECSSIVSDYFKEKRR